MGIEISAIGLNEPRERLVASATQCGAPPEKQLPGNLRKYQIVILGPQAPKWRDQIVTLLKARVNELGDKIWDNIEILEGANVSLFDRSSPVFGIWFGSDGPTDNDQLTTLDLLLYEAKSVQPVVDDIKRFTALTPPKLREINGLPINASQLSKDRIVNSILEGMQLLRRRRRVFISYARADSRAAAKQLFGALAECGFDVFLDTHSVPATTIVQNQLWHSMVDSDLVVLLDSNGIDASHWCRLEYEKADALSIGVVRVLWPGRVINPRVDALLLSLRIELTSTDFISSPAKPTQTDLLTDAAIEKIATSVEGFRARSIAARQANLVRSLEREAIRLKIPIAVQPNSHIHVQKPGEKGHPRKIVVIPIVGVPVSTNFHDAIVEYGGAPPDADAQLILYDRQGFLPHWVDHLSWLNGSLPVKGIDVLEVPAWLSAH